MRRAAKRRQNATGRVVAPMVEQAVGQPKPSAPRATPDRASPSHLGATLLANANALRNPSFPERRTTPFLPPIVEVVRQCLQAVLPPKNVQVPLILPDLRMFDSVALYTDFSGDGDKSGYSTYGFLLCAYQPQPFESRMDEIRRRYGIVGREISYKNLNQQAGIRRALGPYLRAVDNLVPGLLCTICVPDEVEGLILGRVDEDDELHRELDGMTPAKHKLWKRKVMQKALRVFHVASYMLALLGRDRQKVFWMTDHDAIMANAELSRLATAVFYSLLEDYCSFELGKFGWAFPFKDRSNMVHHDLLSAVDLAAGGVARHVGERAGADTVRKECTDLIETWFGTSGIGCRKLNILISPGADPTELSASVMADTDPKGRTRVPLHL